MRVTITGGAGFIGSRLTERLARIGHEIRVLDNFLPQVHGGDPERSASESSVQAHAEVIVGSVTDARALRCALEGADVVVHLAAETGTGQSMYAVRQYVDTNVAGTATLLETIPETSVRRLVLASSRSVYGEGKYLDEHGRAVFPSARSEEALASGRFDPVAGGRRLRPVPTTEDSRLHPSSVYGVSKLTQEQLISTSCPAMGVDHVTLRFQNVYGPGQSLRNPYTGILSIFSSLIRTGSEINIFEDGLESRDFVYVDDVVDALTLAVATPGAANGMFNVGSGRPTTVLEVADHLQRALGRTVATKVSGNYRVGDIRHNFAATELAAEVLGFTARVDFPEGVRRFAEWAETQPVESSLYEQSLAEMRERNLLK